MASVQEFFEGLAARVPADRIAGMNNTYVFDIEGAGAWTVAIADGAIEVTEGVGDADTTSRMDGRDFSGLDPRPPRVARDLGVFLQLVDRPVRQPCTSPHALVDSYS